MNSFTYGLLLLGAPLFAVFVVYTWLDQLQNNQGKRSTLVSKLRANAIKSRHESARLLFQLVETDGAGSWPPRASHYHSWPAALRPYHEIYLELAPLLAVAEPSLDDNVNLERLHRYRSLMREGLKKRVNPSEVRTIMMAASAGTLATMPRDAYNGFYACVSAMRHAYRWATVPIVKVAQNETLLEFPAELDLPWKFFQSRFGFTSPGGNVASSFYCNFDTKGRLQYEINTAMSDKIRKAEYHFGYMFIKLESMALPIYYEMNQSIIKFESGDYESCLKYLKSINSQLRLPLKVFYEGMHDSKIPRSVWMGYVQGFQGWAAGEMVNGEYVEYDGLSGNQALFFRAVDAFAGLESYLTEENIRRYIPIAQQNLCRSYEKHSFRDTAKRMGLREIEVEMQNLIKQFKVFRSAHVTRVMPYLDVPAPERFAMTAGKSVLADSVPGGKFAFGDLKGMLTDRLQQTV